jgi:hypothetical protein
VKTFLEKLAVLVFVAFFLRLLVLAMLDGDASIVWVRFAFAGGLILVLALAGVSLSRLQQNSHRQADLEKGDGVQGDGAASPDVRSLRSPGSEEA